MSLTGDFHGDLHKGSNGRDNALHWGYIMTRMKGSVVTSPREMI